MLSIQLSPPCVLSELIRFNTRLHLYTRWLHFLGQVSAASLYYESVCIYLLCKRQQWLLEMGIQTLLQGYSSPSGIKDGYYIVVLVHFHAKQIPNYVPLVELGRVELPSCRLAIGNLYMLVFGVTELIVQISIPPLYFEKTEKTSSHLLYIATVVEEFLEIVAYPLVH